MTATPSETHEAALSDERLREIIAEAIYNVDPFYESGEYVDSFQVSPGGNLTWDQAKARDAEMAGVHFMLPVTKFSYDAADATLAILARRTQPSAGEVVAWEWWSAGRPDLTWLQHSKPGLVPSRQMRALYATPPDQSRVERLEAEPIDSAPKDRSILVWWPVVAIDEETGDLTATEVGGEWLVTEWNGGHWLEPETLNGLNSVAFDDDREFAEFPSFWTDLPAPRAARQALHGDRS